MKELKTKDEITEFLLYKSPNGDIKVEVFLHNETVWLTQKKMSELFGVGVPAISKHLDNIFNEGELDKGSTVSFLEIVQNEGGRDVKRNVEFYNLDAIIAVGYRINSHRATQFRIWATKILKEYIIKGFAMDDQRLKNPKNIFGRDYFDEQLERIRDIRSSERRFYQKITDIYSECSADYDPNSRITEEFFANVQNKLHFAISGKTAAEIVHQRADSQKENMGLTTWKNAPKGRIRKDDVIIAKNYLTKEELDSLNRIVSMYLDYAEMQAKNKKVMYMEDWIARLDAFLRFNERDILENLGKISAETAKKLAEEEYEKYNIKKIQEYRSDFDKLVEKSSNLKDSKQKVK